MERTKRWYQDKQGGTSTMRIIAMIGAITGALTMLASIVLMFAILRAQAWQAIGMVSVSFPAGAGLFAAGEIAKSFQAKAGG